MNEASMQVEDGWVEELIERMGKLGETLDDRRMLHEYIVALRAENGTLKEDRDRLAKEWRARAAHYRYKAENSVFEERFRYNSMADCVTSCANEAAARHKEQGQ